ncbi:hypothetical protein BJY01DRAFT_202254 [Aspergillus pseudoustus]|uniref:Uncharacterized protein n=1 Tax=Aspergillus pseudoustus TaxID=1810923 RepID=A0ABR4L0E3_9EURO
MAQRVVDKASGQEYTEIVSNPASRFSNGPAWIHESPFWPKGREEGSPNGASPLKHIAMTKLLSDQRALTSKLFENVPWQLASYLWDCLGRSKRRTLHMWKVFATTYPSQFSKIEPYRSMKIEGPQASMRDYLRLAASECLIWQTVLTLGASYARVHDLVELGTVKNLAALEIATPEHLAANPEATEPPATALTDRIIRCWDEEAEITDRFKYLRVMVLKNQRLLSETSLLYLWRLRSLQYLVVYGCPGLVPETPSKLKLYGWMVVDEKPYPPHTLYEFWKVCSEEFTGDRSTLVGPVLDFQIGQVPSPPPRKRGKAKYQLSAIYLQRIGVSTDSRKRKGHQSHGSQSGQQQPRKAVMKNRTKDIGDMLSEFF